jgi:hypothetical protein
MHSLLEKNTEARTGVCSECGPVKIHKTGANSFKCAEAQKARHKKWVQDNPEQAERNRSLVSEHHIPAKMRDMNAKTGVCPICGPVSLVAYGRGWACPNSTATAARAIPQAAPQPRCRICNDWESEWRAFADPTTCQPCAGDLLDQAAAQGDGVRDSSWADFSDPYDETEDFQEFSHGFTVRSSDDHPEALDSFEAVPGWGKRVIGESGPWRPSKV